MLSGKIRRLVKMLIRKGYEINGTDDKVIVTVGETEVTISVTTDKKYKVKTDISIVTLSDVDKVYRHLKRLNK